MSDENKNSKKERTVIPIGPYHPLQEEPEYFQLHVEGEIVKKIEWRTSYNHRGIEKLSQSMSYDQVPYLVERICGICSTSHPLSYVNAVEDLAEIEVPVRAKYIRTIIAELERLHSHLLWVGLAGHFLGFNTVWMWAWKYREPVLEIMEAVTGNRQNYAMMKIGGIRRDIDNEDIPSIKKMLDDLKPKVDLLRGAVMDDPIIHARTKGIGVLTPEDVHNYGALGPTARASGIKDDIRRDYPYAAYDIIDWDVIVEEEGDVFAKAVVRIKEMYESISMIHQCLDALKKENGEIETTVKEIPPGDGIGQAEAPRGEVFHFVRSDGTNRPVRHKVRAPSFCNVPTFEVTTVGETISDAAIILAAVDPCYCCTERMAVINSEGEKSLTGDDLIKMSQQKTERMRKSKKENK
ncbi:MAG: NADH:ubiquinone oxidoreductase [Candidatus Mcinerneyibacterium aminivorans]|uniref:NADH:ubiquinone oxidoreductase n=1 Tax=Candidatus Mcinerneyibacterium aminivorans TaxID=2703815 RepID=A0A5D0MMB1_9BACT|nr:MAG: NADH:ubiquinone oxidoreductase [Candidatus Mcinerneyibacterium aminivorans]